MSADILFTVCNVAVLPGWILLIVAPRWKWTHALVVTALLPVLLGLVYMALIAANLGAINGLLRLADIAQFFENPYCLLAGWVHYLAFDLFVGGWQVRDSQRSGVPHWVVVPCLILTLMLGPTGLVCYFAARAVVTRRLTVAAPAAVQGVSI
ncbi:MAG: ABA4-like family protein [Pirellulaceae bacterium]